MAFSIDPSAQGRFLGTSSGGTPNSLAVSSSISTSSGLGGMICFVCMTMNGGPISSVTSSAGLIFTRLISNGTSLPKFPTEIWTAPVTGTAFSSTFTITQNSDDLFCFDVFCVGGAYANSPVSYDGAAVSFVTGPYGSITTSKTDILINIVRDNNSGATGGAGWTQLFGGVSNTVTQYQLVSGSATTNSAVIGGGGTDCSEIAAITSDPPTSPAVSQQSSTLSSVTRNVTMVATKGTSQVMRPHPKPLVTPSISGWSSASERTYFKVEVFPETNFEPRPIVSAAPPITPQGLPRAVSSDVVKNTRIMY